MYLIELLIPRLHQIPLPGQFMSLHHFSLYHTQGAANCLEGLAFVVTGVLDSIERDAAVTLIQRYGGRTTTAVSKKTDYLVS